MESTLALKRKKKTIEEPMEKQEIWAFTDIECRVDKKIAFKWNTLFQEFQKKSFKFCCKMIQVRNSTKAFTRIFPSLCYIRQQTLVLPCPNVIEWMNRRIDNEIRTILNFEDKHVANYQYPALNQLYHFKEAKVKVTTEWLKNKTEFVDFVLIMKRW